MSIAAPARAPYQVALADRLVWRDAALAWVGQRALLLALIALWQAVLPLAKPQSLFSVWALWDGAHFTDIARGGYQLPVQSAFFPLYPMLVHVVAPVVGGNVTLAAVVVSNAACFGAFLLLRLLIEQDFDRVIARRTLLYLAIFPASMYLANAYSESLFLLLSVGAFVALRGRRWLLVGALAALATLTRSVGLVLLLPIGLVAYQEWRPRWETLGTRARGRAVALGAGAMALPLLAYAGLRLAFRLRFGVWDAPGGAERTWGRFFDWPWGGLIQSFRMVIGQFPSVASMDLLYMLLGLGIAGAMLLPSERAVPRGYVLYTWGSLLLVLAVYVHVPGASPFMSIARFLLMIFPCFVMIARWSLRSRWLHYALVAVSVCDLAALTWLFAQGRFVA